MIKLMTPGPTQIRENVRLSRSLEITNPDLDMDFFNEYQTLCEKIGSLLHTKNPVYIMSGEGILGLEAACASLTEPGDKVLILDNGIFGKGFGDFVSIYGGIPIYYKDSYQQEINIERLTSFLELHHDFKYATLVHCDTPSGVLNEIDKICPLLHKYGILTVVDAVSSMFGEPIDVDKCHIDILCGASQKVISAPPGLTILSVSQLSLQCMRNRTIPIASFYANILNFKDYYLKRWFPYTMPISDIYGLKSAIENIEKDSKIYMRHQRVGMAVRNAIHSSGLELYTKSGYSNTVTVIKVPDELKCLDIITILKEKYNIFIAGGLDILENKVIRIGHMGENCNVDDVAETLDAITNTFELLQYPLKNNLKTSFITSFENYARNSKN